jgi:acetyl-CoA carboxylase carboxyltransferase component
VIFLADNPGVLAGSVAERDGILRAGARMFAAQHRLQSPKLHVTLRKAFGFGSSVMAMNPFDNQTLSLAFPGATLGAMPARGGGTASKADASLQQQLDEHEIAGPYKVADSLGFDEVIDPRDLRNALLKGLEVASERLGGPFAPVARFGFLP